MSPLYIFLLSFLIIASASAQTEQTSVIGSPTSTSFFSKEKWGASYLNYMNGPAFAEDEGKYSINHYLSLKHKFSPDWNLAMVFRPDQKVGAIDQNEKTFTQGDSYLSLGLPSYYKGNDGGKIYSQLRYYAPLSESSKKKKSNGKIVPRTYATTSIKKFELTYILIPTIYLNQVKESGQAQYSHDHWFQVSYKMSDALSFDMAASPGWSYSRDEKREFNNITVYPGFTYNFSENVSVSPYLEIISMKSESKTTTFGASLSYTLL